MKKLHIAIWMVNEPQAHRKSNVAQKLGAAVENLYNHFYNAFEVLFLSCFACLIELRTQNLFFSSS
jgi:hypothetical protein